MNVMATIKNKVMFILNLAHITVHTFLSTSSKFWKLPVSILRGKMPILSWAKIDLLFYLNIL